MTIREPRSDAALIIIPGTVNYFYNLSGHRIAEALGTLGFAVDVSTLGECPEGDYDWCLLSNITEILHAYGDEADGLERIRAIGGRCRAVASLSIDCVSTPWYHRIRDLSASAGAGLILDLGLHDQGQFLEPDGSGELPVRVLGADSVGGAAARGAGRGRRRADDSLGVRRACDPAPGRAGRSPDPVGRSPRLRLHAARRRRIPRRDLPI